jgi:vitamin B12/bleomycin/antimicrobial peptide transport system ATP-binding/permease protein
MARDPSTTADKARLAFRFWETASGFWQGPTAGRAWSLTLLLVAIIVLQLVVQYRLIYWYRDFFDAFGRRAGSAVLTETLIFIPLVAASITLAIVSVWGRMATQRTWREWLSRHLIDHWLSEGHHLAPAFTAGERQSPEYRIAEDARVATEIPVDLAFGLLTAVLTAVVFIDVLWRIGGSLAIDAFGQSFRLPAYLVIAVVLYSATLTTAMLAVCRRLPRTVEGKNQAEAELRSMASRLCRIDEGPRAAGRTNAELRGLRTVLNKVIQRWRDLSAQLMRFTLVSHANLLIAPVIAWIICAPNYLRGTMTLGEVAQASAAFVTVQAALNWVVGNYQNLAEWTASVNRVSALLLTWDRMDVAGSPRPLAPAESGFARPGRNLQAPELSLNTGASEGISNQG